MKIKNCSLLLATVFISSIYCADKAASDAEQKEALDFFESIFGSRPSNSQNVDYGEQNVFVRAAGEGNLDAVKRLIASKALVNHDDISGNFALVEASKFGHKDVVDFLLQQRADINIQDNEKQTGLIAACLNEYGYDGHPEVIKLLLQHKAKPNIKDLNHVTALFIACKRENEHTTKLLIQHNADVDQAYGIMKWQIGDTSSRVKCTLFLDRMCCACYKEDVAKLYQFQQQMKSILGAAFADLKPLEMPQVITGVIASYCGDPVVYPGKKQISQPAPQKLASKKKSSDADDDNE